MRNFTVLLLITLITGSLYAQAPAFSRAAKGGGIGKDVAHSVAVSNDGSVYVAAEFTGTAAFGTINLISAGNVDYCLVKYDSTGTALWGIRGGGTLTDRGYGVAVDPAGNVYTCGEYFGTAVFGTDTLTSAGNLDAFAAKYDPSGNRLWMKDIKGDVGNFQEATRGMVVDNNGNAIVTGYFGGSSAITSVTFDTITVTSYGLRDIFLVKYNTNGEVQWAKHYGGVNSTEEGRSVTVDDAGNIYLTGTINGTANFDAIVVNGNLGTDMFVAKISPDGNVIWVRTAGGPKEDDGNGVAVDQSGNVYVCGRLDSAMVISGNTLNGFGGYDPIIAKYNSAGDFQWVMTAGGTGNDYGYEVSVDESGMINLMGTFVGSAYFGDDTLTSAGGDDIFLAQFNPAGTPLWLKHVTGSDVDKGFGMDVDYGGNIYITGSFKGATLNLDGFVFSSLGVEDVFYGRLGNNPVPVELLSFTASVNGRNIQLDWSTATEVNNSGFEVERSTDKTNYENITFIPGNGTTTERKSYSFTDNNLNPGVYYYRLKQVDLDGAFSYSSVIEVNVEIPGEYNLSQNYPNPFNPSTEIAFSVPVDASVTISFFNALGEKVNEFSKDFSAGTYNYSFNGNNLSSGIYFYTINAAGKDGSSYNSSKKMMLIK